jgi:hypothetical protein
MIKTFKLGAVSRDLELPDSTLVSSQVVKKHYELSDTTTLDVNLRYDDRNNNGHNTFSITGELRERGRIEVCGCIHDIIAVHAYELAPFIKWHLTSSDGPMYYLENTTWHAGTWLFKGAKEEKERDFKAARSTAVWEDAPDNVLALPKEELAVILLDRLPALMTKFKEDMLTLGFEY